MGAPLPVGCGSPLPENSPAGTAWGTMTRVVVEGTIVLTTTTILGPADALAQAQFEQELGPSLAQ